eukprot:m.225091 g.225091  ORF g.225091 m.225091 type:complete len:253 (-) comp33451_c0_seq2:445-1203(-)
MDYSRFEAMDQISFRPFQAQQQLMVVPVEPIDSIVRELLGNDVRSVPSSRCASNWNNVVLTVPEENSFEENSYGYDDADDEFSPGSLSMPESQSQSFFFPTLPQIQCSKYQQVIKDEVQDFINPGPVCAMGPRGLNLIHADTIPARKAPSPPPLDEPEQKYTACSATSNTSANKSRRSNQRLSPLPKNWSEELLRMPTKELNLYLKQQHFTSGEIAELKTCRRRIKNRGYTRQSRQRKSSNPNDSDNTDSEN